MGAKPLPPAVRMVGIEKSFNGAAVLRGSDLAVHPGEVLGLVGPNGSGKSTVAGILCGEIEPDAGELWIGDSKVEFRSPSAALAYGVRRLAQSLEIYPALSVVENIFVGQELAYGLPGVRLMAWGQMSRVARELLERVGAGDVSPLKAAGTLSGGQQQAVALARLLAVEGQVLVLDEPTTALGVQQRRILLEAIATEAAKGRSVILISHDVDDVLTACNRVVALRKGQVDCSLLRPEFDKDRIALMMSGA